MVATIELPVGSEFIRVVEIPKLIADALNPDPGLLPRTLNCFVKSIRAGADGAMLKDSLDSGDHEKLEKIWLEAGLPLPTPTTEKELQPYLEAANNSTAIKWELGVVWHDAQLTTNWVRKTAMAKHLDDLKAAVLTRQLKAVMPHDRLPVNGWNELAVVSVNDLRQYVAEFRIELMQAQPQTKSPNPAASAPLEAIQAEEVESAKQRRNRYLEWHIEEEKICKRGALQRVFEREHKQNPKADRSNIGKAIKKACNEQVEEKRAGVWKSQLVQGGKRTG